MKLRRYGPKGAEKPALVEETACRLLQPMAEHEVVLKLRPAEIEVTVLEPELFGRKLLASPARDGDGGSFGGTYHFDAVGAKLDLARLHFCVSHLRGPGGDFAFDQDDGFEAQPACPFDHFGGRPIGIERDLDEPCAVPEVDENDPAKISRSVHPTAEPDFGTRVGGSELTAKVRSPGGSEAG